MKEEQKKLDELKKKQITKPESGAQKAAMANEAINLLNNPAFNRAYQRVFNRLLSRMLAADSPKSVVIERDKMKLLDDLTLALNADITQAELEAWRNENEANSPS